MRLFNTHPFIDTEEVIPQTLSFSRHPLFSKKNVQTVLVKLFEGETELDSNFVIGNVQIDNDKKLIKYYIGNFSVEYLSKYLTYRIDITFTDGTIFHSRNLYFVYPFVFSESIYPNSSEKIEISYIEKLPEGLIIQDVDVSFSKNSVEVDDDFAKTFSGTSVNFIYPACEKGDILDFKVKTLLSDDKTILIDRINLMAIRSV